jgi:hypothetical protein
MTEIELVPSTVLLPSLTSWPGRSGYPIFTSWVTHVIENSVNENQDPKYTDLQLVSEISDTQKIGFGSG